MLETTVVARFRECGMIPVVTLDDLEKAPPLVQALVKGGIVCVEFTFRTPKAADIIHNIRELYPNVLVGAGSVINEKQAKAAIAADAQFVVSPGTPPPGVVHYCKAHNIALFPGVYTATEIIQALWLGFQVLKYFPAGGLPGLDRLKTIAAPFPEAIFIPTGGIDINNMVNYLKFPRVVAVGGSWITPDEMINQSNFSGIEDRAWQVAETKRQMTNRARIDGILKGVR